MNDTEEANLIHLINRRGVDSGKVCKVNGEWFIIPNKTRVKKIAAPINNMPPRQQWGDDDNAIVIEGVK